MGSRDRDTRSLQDKLKVFFKKGASAALPARNELVVTAEMERELGPEATLPRRLRALKELSERTTTIRIQEGCVKKLWSCTRDLWSEPVAEARQAALVLVRCVLEAAAAGPQGPADELSFMRAVVLRQLQDTHATRQPDDETLRLRLLQALTCNGKNIKCFEEQIGPFLLEWLPQIQSPALTVEFLELIINVVKFNAAYLDEDIVHGFVIASCQLVEGSGEGGAAGAALALLEAVVSYSWLPRGALPAFVHALCRAVNVEARCQPSWKLMRSVLGADIGHAALHQLAALLRRPAAEADAGLARGAVFYINMALWGPCRVHSLHVSCLGVLPALRRALAAGRAVVVYEVVLAVQSLVARAPLELHEPAWDAVLDIVRAALDHDARLRPPNELLHARVHALVSSLEQLQDAGQYRGSDEALLDLVDRCGHERPEPSAMRLVTLRAAALSPTGAAWVPAALHLHDKYVRSETRLPVRLHALHALLDFVRRQHALHDEVVERVALPMLSAASSDAEASLRCAAAEAARWLARRAAPAPATELVDLLETVLNRPFDMFVSDVPVPADEAGELRAAAGALLDVLHDRLLAAPPHVHVAARAYIVLLDHLDHHYRRPALFQHHPDIRLKILEMVFGLRVNSFNCVGFCYDTSGAPVWGAAAARLKPVCSPYLLAEGGAGASTACVVPVGRCARALATALTRERDWAVLGHVLRALPSLLHARALAVGRRAHELDLLAGTLCAMLAERAPAERPPLSEFHACVLGALAALPPHHAELEPPTQQRIVRCLLRHGMVLRTPQPYIAALTVFTLEMRDTMVKMLPEVLLDLSKISDTAAIASPMLEFLSTLTRLPRVFASFVEDQYMSVFAILLPYTNPSRYNHYVVSLAHHVIAAWFLKCRLSYRKNFVRFIIHGLHNYIIMPFEEQLQYKSSHFQQPAAANSHNEDSSARQRSSSLGSRAPSSGRAGSSSASASFHVELTETCVDLLARYASSPVSVKPRRAPAAEFLLAGGHSATWLVGHKLITITTAGCTQNSIRQGLCDRCATLCRQHADSVSSPLPPLSTAAVDQHNAAASAAAAAAAPQVFVGEPPPDDADAGAGVCSDNNTPEVKRYSKYSLQHSRSTETSCSSLSISDTSLLAPSSGHSTRQNSSENKPNDSVMDVLNQFSQRFDRISKEVDAEEAGWSRVGALAAGGGCPCWCAGWAELTVRSPTGDVSWLMRTQNMMSWDYLLESPLAEVAALLSPCPAEPGARPTVDHRRESCEEEPRARSGSQGRRPPATQDLHKSSSDSVVSSSRRAPLAASHCILPPPAGTTGTTPTTGTTGTTAARASTQPINIPGSPQRQSSSSTTDDDDMLLIVPESKSRHPVRRSNSSPEMSSSWKIPARTADDGPEPPAADHDDMILLPSCEPTSTSMSLHASKKAAKRGDMRVSCEAIPEEMSGTSPLAPPPAPAPAHTPAPAPAHTPAHHPHLMTYNSDPGSTEGAPHHQLQKTASDSTVSSSSKPPRPPAGGGAAAGAAAGGGAAAGAAVGAAAADRDDLPPLSRSKRSHTISVMSPTRRHREGGGRGAAPAGGGGGGAGAGGGAVGGGGGGVTPAFVFLQLYHNMSTYPITPPVPGEAPPMLSPLAERPLRVSGVQHERTIKNLDLVPPLETYKVGVLYVGPGQQDNEVLILKNEYGSVRYAMFLSGLGSLVALAGAGADDQPGLFLNLEKGGKDGRYTYVWHDDIMQVLFHVATAMPSSPKDPTCNEKRKYIGNDFVSIVYNDSDADFNIHTIKGQLNFCIVVVEPSSHGMNRVFVKTKDEQLRAKFLAHLDTYYVSDHNVALLARQLALHTALAAQIAQSLKLGGGAGAAYASNSLERLRLIKRLRRRLEAERLAAAARAPAPYAGAPDLAARVASDDFNHYT